MGAKMTAAKLNATAMDRAARPAASQPAAARLVARVARLALSWHWRHRTRASLKTLPEHLLADIGLTRAQAETESLKRFWMP
jgi:uncharacterized protein YjiS (DUF1127 family)